MALSNAERQAAYRQRHLKDVDGSRERLNMILEQDAVLALRRLAAHRGESQAETLRTLILGAQSRTTSQLRGEAWSLYHAIE